MSHHVARKQTYFLHFTFNINKVNGSILFFFYKVRRIMPWIKIKYYFIEFYTFLILCPHPISHCTYKGHRGCIYFNQNIEIWKLKLSIRFKIQYGRSFDHHGYNKFKCHLTAIADFRFSSVETLIELDWSFLLYKLHLQFCRNSDSHKDCLLKKKPLIFCNNSLKLSNFILWGELCRFLT